MNRLAWSVLLCIASITTAHAQQSPAPSTKCADLAKLSLPNTRNLKAEMVEAGKFPAPESWRPSAQDAEVYKRMPAFCRVTAELTPSADSDIKIEV